ncbi:glycoside hydrolase family 15 protein [Endozoicomonas ascidiicola]|uniref:glycoside hydrolase family 15 protein n=1 Tax=Endozoicomonas ascidiicola TaxID=1698521 RepID=UPI000834E79E|nr:glycoside hydrolase family 15 protein [Endozoicomonas ascidiicola]
MRYSPSIAIRSILFILVFGFLSIESHATSSPETKQQVENYRKVQTYLSKHPPYQSVLAAEGRFINVFNPELLPYIKAPLNAKRFRKLEKLILPHLTINLTSKGFAQAAERVAEGEKDDTNYNAIWVRDSGWIFFSMLERGQVNAQEKEKARRLILALWDYYATDRQLKRMKAVIDNPKLANQGTMNVLHIRFDGNSPSLDDVYVNGKPQNWNHRQNDAHGIFLMAVAEGWSKGLIKKADLTPSRLKVLSLFPAYFNAIDFATFEDAGAWEEISKVNTSSVAFVVRAMELWGSVLKANADLQNSIEQAAKKEKVKWSNKLLNQLVDKGYATIKRQLTMGGESPDYPPTDLRFRRADAALFNLILPTPLARLSQNEKRQVVTILERLERPFGIIRYARDSYQSGNFWIKAPGASKHKDAPALTGDASSETLFLARLANLIPDTEAQWFFDSKLAMIRAHLAEGEKDKLLQLQDVFFAQVHLKRALGQVTGSYGKAGLIAADGNSVADWKVPESINSVKIGDELHYLPSPITPLNWAKASLSMALGRVEFLLK